MRAGSRAACGWPAPPWCAPSDGERDRMARRRLVLASALASWLPLGAARAQAERQAAGQVTARDGSVVVVRAEGDQPLEPGDALYRGDQIRTGPAAKLRIECEGGLVIVIGPRTDIGIDEYLPAQGGSGLGMVLGLLTGIVRLIGPAQAPQRLEVRTRVALASVRSTDWLVPARAPGTALFSERGRGGPPGPAVCAREGRGGVRGTSGGEVLLEPGFGTDVALGRPPEPPHA